MIALETADPGEVAADVVAAGAVGQRHLDAARALAQSTGANLSSMIDNLDVENAESNRTLMGDVEIERYAAEGRAMSLADAVAYALEEA